MVNIGSILLYPLRAYSLTATWILLVSGGRCQIMKVRVMGYPKIAIIVLNGGYQRGRGIGLGVVYSFSVI